MRALSSGTSSGSGEPLWLLRGGAQYIVRVTLAAGDGTRLAPLPVSRATRLRIAVGSANEEPPLQACL